MNKNINFSIKNINKQYVFIKLFLSCCHHFLQANTINFTKMSRYEQLKKIVTELEDDFQKFYEKDVQAAGTRIRKGMQDLKTLAQEIRIEIQDKKNAKEEAKS
jgi:hypothetical protein